MFKTHELIVMAAVVFMMLVTVWVLRTEARFAAFWNTSTQTAATGQVLVGDSGMTWQEAVRNSVDDRGAVRNLIIDDVVPGTGDPVESGDTVTVHYQGTLTNGQEFDNSRSRGEPFTFRVGRGDVIAGWEEGVLGMREGGSRILVIPPDMAYGARGYGPVPANATLVFSIELLSIR